MSIFTANKTKGASIKFNLLLFALCITLIPIYTITVLYCLNTGSFLNRQQPMLFDSSTVEQTKLGSSTATTWNAANSTLKEVGVNNYSPPVFRCPTVELSDRV